MGRYTVVVDIDARRERAFDLWTDLSRLHQWSPGVVRVTDPTGPSDQPATRYRIWSGVLTTDVEVLDAVRPLYVRTRHKMGQIKYVTNTTFEALDDGTTRLRHSLSSGGVIGSVWARLLGTGSWPGSLRAELSRFARLAESEAPFERPLVPINPRGSIPCREADDRTPVAAGPAPGRLVR